VQRSSESTRWLLARAAVVAVALFALWLTVKGDVEEAAVYAAVLGAVEAVLGFGFKAWRRRDGAPADPWDPQYDE